MFMMSRTLIKNDSSSSSINVGSRDSNSKNITNPGVVDAFQRPERGFVFTFGVVLCLGVAWGVVTLLPSLELQLLAFIAFTNYRALLPPGRPW